MTISTYTLTGSYSDAECFQIATTLLGSIPRSPIPDVQTAIIERKARKALGKATIMQNLEGHAYTVTTSQATVHGPVLDGCLLAAMVIQRGLWKGRTAIRVTDLISCLGVDLK